VYLRLPMFQAVPLKGYPVRYSLLGRTSYYHVEKRYCAQFSQRILN
jgi:hypothetical protein